MNPANQKQNINIRTVNLARVAYTVDMTKARNAGALRAAYPIGGAFVLHPYTVTHQNVLSRIFILTELKTNQVCLVGLNGVRYTSDSVPVKYRELSDQEVHRAMNGQPQDFADISNLRDYMANLTLAPKPDVLVINVDEVLYYLDIKKAKTLNLLVPVVPPVEHKIGNVYWYGDKQYPGHSNPSLKDYRSRTFVLSKVLTDSGSKLQLTNLDGETLSQPVYFDRNNIDKNQWSVLTGGLASNFHLIPDFNTYLSEILYQANNKPSKPTPKQDSGPIF